MSIRLTIDEEYRSALAAAGLDTFDALMHADAGEIVTRRKGRETRRVTLPFGDSLRTIYIKRIFHIGPKHSFWPRLAGRSCHTPAVKEFQVIQKLMAAGIPAPRAVACGERRMLGIPRCGFLVTEAAPIRWTLNDWLTEGYARPRALTGEERIALMRGFGELITELSKLGAYWPDLKAKHVFAEPNAAGDWRFCLIDVERMTFQSAIAHPGFQAHRQLVVEGHWFVAGFMPTRMSVPEFRALLCGASLGELLEINRVGVEHRSARQSGRSDRLTWLFANRYGGDRLPCLPNDYRHPNTLPMEKHGGIRVDSRFLHALRNAGLDSYDRVMAYTGGRTLGKPGLAGYRERIRLSIDVDGETQTMYLKRYRQSPLREQLRRMAEFRFRRGSAEREMHYIRQLGLLGIPTMTRVAFGSRMSGSFERDGFAITAQVPGESLETLTAAWNSSASTEGGRFAVPSPCERREIIDQLARIASRMHGNQLFHRDFYLCHLFLSKRDDGRIVLSVIDLARMIRSSLRSRRWVIKDLAALDYSAPRPLVTRADRLRFLYHYLHSWRDRSKVAFRNEVRRIAASVSERTQRMARHDAARRRRLEQD